MTKVSRDSNISLTEKVILSISEVASYTGYKESYLYKLCSQRKIPHFKPFGGRIFFDKNDIISWLTKNRVKTNDELEMEAEILKKTMYSNTKRNK